MASRAASQMSDRTRGSCMATVAPPTASQPTRLLPQSALDPLCASISAQRGAGSVKGFHLVVEDMAVTLAALTQLGIDLSDVEDIVGVFYSYLQ